MALLSSLVIIRALSVAHITIAFFFLTAPKLIAEQNIVVILGASMHLVRPNFTIVACLPNTDSKCYIASSDEFR